MPMPSKGRLLISALPSPQILALWRQNGIGHLLNVSGVDAYAIYQPGALAGFSVSQEKLVDVFTTAPPLAQSADAALDGAKLYLQLTDEGQRLAFLSAVRTLLDKLHTFTPTAVFCHRGQGRSPLVAAAALQAFYHEPIADAVSRVQALHPPAQFTHASLSALQWCVQTFGG